MKKRVLSHREHILAGLFALMAMAPVVTDMQIGDALRGSVTGTSIDRAFANRDDQSVLRRMRWSIIRDCAQRETAGEKGVCPDMNDTRALNRYWFPAEHESATIEETIAATVDQLSGYQQRVLKQATRVGECPMGLDRMVPGFQALCEKTIVE